MKAILCVGGVFNDDGGRQSGYFGQLYNEVRAAFPEATTVLINGGLWSELQQVASVLTSVDCVIWAADVPNDKPKLIDDLKSRNPNMMLVVTKSNMKGEYTRKHLVARALKVKANLLIEFQRTDEGKVMASIIDPLGNCFLSDSEAVRTVAQALADRLRFLATMTRVRSVRIGERPHQIVGDLKTDYFFSLVRGYAKEFHRLIHIDDNGRMLGNLSFRCEEGFPSVRLGDLMMVSKRNVDKRDIGMDAMVPVLLHGTSDVAYLGEAKPSVDTPVQRALYQRWSNANFMLHAHVYIADAPFTENTIPCGALQEVDEILKVLPWYDGRCAAYINIEGHGSLAIARRADMLTAIPYIARPLV